MVNEQYELTKSIRNRCDIALWLMEAEVLEHTLPTLFEDIYIDAQEIIDQCCIESR